MNTKLIMAATAALLFLIGVPLIFAADHVITILDMSASPTNLLTLQLLGATYFSFAMLNWMAKGTIIGGIYNRPIALANVGHFMIGGLALIKAVMRNQHLPIIFSVMAGCFILLACVFGVMVSRHPLPAKG